MGGAGGHVGPAGADQISSVCGTVTDHFDGVAAGPAFEKAREPAVLAGSAGCQLAVSVQLLLASKPEVRRDKPLVVGQGKMLLLQIPILALGPVTLADHVARMGPIKSLHLLLGLKAFGEIPPEDILTGPSIKRAM